MKNVEVLVRLLKRAEPVVSANFAVMGAALALVGVRDEDFDEAAATQLVSEVDSVIAAARAVSSRFEEAAAKVLHLRVSSVRGETR